jgi:DedD protein
VKERLTGAIILVALLVLLVPELLTGPSPKSAAKPAGPEGAPLRSYTIDLADDAAARPPPATAPTTEASDEPVAQAKPQGAGDTATGAASPQMDVPADETAAASATGPPRGSGADPSAAGPAARPESGPAASAEPERPRSAFGPNAVSRAQTDRAKTGSAKAGLAQAEPPRSESVKADPAKAEPARAEGWAVQLGVFASRDNAERLVRQVRAKGYAVVVNEASGNGKRLYRVRVGPQADHDAAVALGAKLRAAGHGGSVVPYP